LMADSKAINGMMLRITTIKIISNEKATEISRMAGTAAHRGHEAQRKRF